MMSSSSAAQLLISFNGAYFVTGTQITFAFLLSSCAAFAVAFLSIGLPSVVTITTDWALGRPNRSIDSTLRKAPDVYVPRLGNFSLLNSVLAAALSAVN